MFEAIRSNKRITQVILAIIIVPFAFFGMDAYFSGGPGGGDVATVGDYSITVAEFDQALRTQQDRMRQSMGRDFDSSMVHSDDFRRAVLDNLINRHLLAMHAEEHRISVPEQALQQAISQVPAFAGDNGNFSMSRYQDVLAAQGMSPDQFERSMAQDLRVQQLIDGVAGSGFASRAGIRQVLLAQLEEREIDVLRLPVNDLLDEVEVDTAELEAYYEANTEQFQQPPRLRAAYVVLDEAATQALVTVDESEARERYEANQSEFGQPEERRARHILIRVDDESAAEQARERAEALLARLREGDVSFAELAEQESDDAGSAVDGGDLGFFARGAMVSEFEEAVFDLEPGTVSEPVRTDFGYHLIEVTDVREDSIKPFEQVREQLLDELRREKAARRYPVLAEEFSNTVYEQPDSLEPVADSLDLEVRTSDWIERDDEALNGIEDARVIKALFSEEVLELKENTEAFEVERGTMVAARVADYEPARTLSFEEVRDQIAETLRRERAAKLASERGQARIASLMAEEDSVAWDETLTVQRAAAQLPPAGAEAVFAVPSADVPTFVGAQLDNGDFAIYHVKAVNRPELEEDDPRVQRLGQQYDAVIAELDFDAFLAALREHYGVQINAELLSRDAQR